MQSMKNKDKFSFIIVSYNSAKTLKECLRSAFKQRNSEIIVVDNMSSDNSVELLKSLEKRITLICNKKNSGFGGGNNLGAKKANGKYLVFLNPDAVLPKNFTKSVVEAFKIDQNLGILGFKFINKDKSLQRTGNSFPTMASLLYENSGYHRLFPNSKSYNNYIISGWDRNSSRYVDAVSGACFVIKRSDFEKIGGFDEKLFLFFEEFDLAKRVLKINKRIFFDANIVVEHVGGVSMSSNKNRSTDTYMKTSQEVFIKKHYGHIYWLIFCVLRKAFDIMAKILSPRHKETSKMIK